MIRLARRVYARLLARHPAATGTRQEQMLRTFTDSVRDARRRGGRGAALFEVLAEYADLVSSGLSARRAAGRALVSAPFRGGTHVIPTWLEWQRAFRRIIAQPGYAALVVIVLGLGIGANTIVFSVADATLFRGVPYPNGARLFEVFNQDPVQKFSYPGLLPQFLDEWRRHPEIFSRVEAWSYATFVLTGGDEPESIGGLQVTPGLFDMLGVRPAIGRPFEPGEGQPGRDRVALLSDGLWRKHFGADPGAIGKDITLNDVRYTIIGVMPRGFRYPNEPQKVWIPTAEGTPEAPRRLDVAAIVAPGLNQDAAQARLDSISGDLDKARPLAVSWHARLMKPRATFVDDTTRRALQILFGAVVLVLLIACANVANLFLAQALARQREIAIRAALGATRWRLVRELLAESLVLAGSGGLLGLGIAWWGVGAAAALAPEQLTKWSASVIGIDTRVLLFTAAITVGTGILFGVLPAFRASRSGAPEWLKGRTQTGSGAVGRTRYALVVAEVALSVVLLVGASLLIRSFVQLTHVDVGFTADHLLTVTLSLPADRYPFAERRRFYENLAHALRALHGVTAVTVANGVPPSGGSIHFSERVEAEGGTTSDKLLVLPNTSISPDYFATLGIPIVEGRTFAPDDPPDSVIVSRSMADRFWPGVSPIGHRLRIFASAPWLTVVGVAGEVRQMGIDDRKAQYEIYSPMWTERPKQPTAAARPSGPRSFTQSVVIIRAADPMSLVPSIKAAVWALDRNQPLGQVALVEHLLGESIKEQRFALVLMAVFAGIALLLAAGGLYGVLAHVVLQRRQEIGIRLALGAQAADVLRLIVSRGLGLTLVGLVLGLSAAYVLSRYVSGQLYEVSARDPVSFVAVGGVLTFIAALACWIPTRRALSIDPALALRAE